MTRTSTYFPLVERYIPESGDATNGSHHITEPRAGCTVNDVSPEAFPAPAMVCLAPQGKTLSRA